MAALLYHPWWDIHIIHSFKRTDFTPSPDIDSVLLQFSQKPTPKLSQPDYYDFVAYSFIHNRQAKFISASQYMTDFKQNSKNTSGSYAKLLKQQNQLQKIHRTPHKRH